MHPRKFLNFYAVIAILVLFENFLGIIFVYFLTSIRHLHQIWSFFVGTFAITVLKAYTGLSEEVSN